MGDITPVPDRSNMPLRSEHQDVLHYSLPNSAISYTCASSTPVHLVLSARALAVAPNGFSIMSAPSRRSRFARRLVPSCWRSWVVFGRCGQVEQAVADAPRC